jgi:ribosomal protein L11 methyltransferase
VDKNRIADPPTDAAGTENAGTTVARLVADAAQAQGLADLLADQLGEASAVACYANGARWCVEVQFPAAPDKEAVRRDVARLAGEETARALQFETIAAKDWVAASLAGLAPVGAGRFLLHGAHDRGRVPANRVAIEIDASLAFGTGHHGTTRACLLALDRLLKARHRRRTRAPAGQRSRRASALDIGTGTGVLAIAAAKAMRTRVLASDLDPVAVRIASENIRRNGVGRLVAVIEADGLTDNRVPRHGPYSLVFVNILLNPLKRLAAGVARVLAPGGRVILSGLLPAQANAAVAIYCSHGLRLQRQITLDGWTTLALARAQTRPARRRRVARA